MTLRQRLPVVIILGLTTGLLLSVALDARRETPTDWYMAVIAVVLAVACGWAGPFIARQSIQAAPEWTHRFEIRAYGWGHALCCNRCDTQVMPFSGGRATLPRILSYAWQHWWSACEPRRAADPDSTRRIAVPSRLRGRGLRKPSDHRPGRGG